MRNKTWDDIFILVLLISLATNLGLSLAMLYEKENHLRRLEAASPATQAACPQPADLDETCSAWLFNTDLKQAKAKICQKH